MVACRRGCRSPGRGGRLRRLGQAAQERVADLAGDAQIAVACIGALHQVPRRCRRAGPAQQGFDRRQGLVVAFVQVEVDVVQAHTLRLLAGLRDPLAALVRRQMQPDLEHQRPVFDQHLLQAARVLQAPGRLFDVALAGELVRQQAQPIAPGVDADLAARRQHLPVAPEARVVALQVLAPAEEVGLQVARVHPVVQEVQHLAHALVVVAGEHDHHGDVTPAHLELGVQQVDPQLWQGLLVLLLGDLGSDFGNLEHDLDHLTPAGASLVECVCCGGSGPACCSWR